MNKKYLKGLLSLSLSGLMAASLAAPVFAATDTNVEAYITKEFDMPVGTEFTSKTFNFSLGELQKDGTKMTGKNETLESKEITIKKEDNHFVRNSDSNNEKRYNSYLHYTDLLSDSDKEVLTKDPGQYSFLITETADQQVPPTTENGVKHTTNLTYSKAVYKAELYVKTKTDGTNYISSIKVTKEKDDTGTEITSVNEKKVDPSKPDGTDDGKGGLRFVNTFTDKIETTGDPGEIPDPDPKNPTNTDNRDKVLSVGKIVNGDLADKNKYFEFSVKVTQPSLVTTTNETYKAKIFKAANGGQDTDKTKNPNMDDKGEFSFTSGSDPVKVYLAHGEKLVFENLYVGTAFEAQETEANNLYTPLTYVKFNSGNPETKSQGNANVTGNVSEGTDTVVVVNTRNSTSPTGIIVNNLPYILLVLGVVAGFAGYIASKRRREVR